MDFFGRRRDSSSPEDGAKEYIQTAAIICTFVLMIILGLKIMNMQRNSSTYELLFTQIRDKLKELTNDVTSLEKRAIQSKNTESDQKYDLFNKLNKRLKGVQKMIKQIEQNSIDNLLKRPKEQLTLKQRIEIMYNTIHEQSVLLNLLELSSKEIIRQEKIAKFDQIVKGDYFKPEKKRNPWIMQRGNIVTPFMDQTQLLNIQKQYQKQAERLEKQYNLNHYKTEIPFCIIVPSFNNAKNFRYEFNLQSIFNQQYDNYRVVIVDDASSDNTTALIKHFMKRYPQKSKKVVLLTNKKQMTAVPNIHMAITKHCKPNEIGFFVDGDDELVGRKVFKVFNAIYQSKKPAVAYSISLEYWVFDDFVKDGWSKPYTQEQKAGNLYRDVPQKISHLRSFRIDLYLQIKERDLKDINGQWFTSTYDEVICLPMLEMSCGNIEVIDQYLYLYVYGTGFNDRLVDSSLQWSIANYVKTKMPKYQCNKKYANFQM